MDRHQPMEAPAVPLPKMRITWGWCPEFWRWRVAAVSSRGITLVDSKGRVRIAQDQWLPWLAGRCDVGATYVENQRIRCPAAVPLFLPGDVREPTPPPRQEPQTRADDLATRLQQAREVLAHYRVLPAVSKEPGVHLVFDGVAGKVQVDYELGSPRGPRCSCKDFGRQQMLGVLCRHALAALLRDPAAKVMLLRYLV